MQRRFPRYRGTGVDRFPYLCKHLALIEAYERRWHTIIDRLSSRNFRDRDACRCPARSDNYFISVGRKIVTASDLSDWIIGEPISSLDFNFSTRDFPFSFFLFSLFSLNLNFSNFSNFEINQDLLWICNRI